MVQYADEESPNQGMSAVLTAKSSHSLNLRKRLDIEKQLLTEKIKNIDELIQLLDENPAIEKFQNLSAKIHF